MAVSMEEDLDLALAMSLSQEYSKNRLEDFSNEIEAEQERDEKWLDDLLTNESIDNLTAVEVCDNLDYSFSSDSETPTVLPTTLPPIYRVTADYYELNDPTPSIHQLFTQFDQLFFYSKLGSVSVEWSYKMTSCAGITYYKPMSHFCYIRLSRPILVMRPRKDLVETLLHEMIHSFLFVAEDNRDHTDHGCQFQFHKLRINSLASCNITIYHSFHDEVNSLKTHWWRCSGSCRYSQPYYGYVKRAINRPPQQCDTWWDQHMRTCGGRFEKIKSPDKSLKVVNKSTTTKVQKQVSETTSKQVTTPKKTKTMEQQNKLIFKPINTEPIYLDDYSNMELICNDFTPPNSPIVISSPETDAKPLAEIFTPPGQLKLKLCYFCGGYFGLDFIEKHFEDCVTYFPG